MKLISVITTALLALCGAAKSPFQENIDHIDTVKQSGARWTLDVNKYATLPNDKFTKMFQGYSMTYDPNRVNPIDASDVPDSWDWRDHDIVGEIKDQAQCGSCWAFSAVGALESQIAKVTGTTVVLSEQEMVDCVVGVKSPDGASTCCYGCQGGEMYSVYQYLHSRNTEDDTESQYPYEGVNQNCQAVPSTVKAKVSGYKALPIGDEVSIKAALYHHGPLSVGVDANLDWQLYRGGIYNPSEAQCSSDPSEMDHGVIIVGYGTEKGLDYWIVRNSWGTSWGENGYIRIARGTNACGVANSAIYPIVESTEDTGPFECSSCKCCRDSETPETFLNEVKEVVDWATGQW